MNGVLPRILFLIQIASILLFDLSEAGEHSWIDRYFGYEYTVTHSRTYYNGSGGLYSIGKGSTQQASERPTMTTEMIRDVFFPPGDPRFPSTKMFAYDVAEMRRRYEKAIAPTTAPVDSRKKEMMQWMLLGAQSRLASEGLTDTDEMRKLQKVKEVIGMEGTPEEKGPVEVRVKMAFGDTQEKPVLVGSQLYFWGDISMPRYKLLRPCHFLNVINHPDKIKLCVDPSLKRCERNLGEVLETPVPVPVTYSILSKTSKLAWLCPASTACCEWECCTYEETKKTMFAPPDGSFRGTVHACIAVFGPVIVIVGSLCCCFGWQRKEQEVARQANASTPQRRAQPERQPLVTSDYPRQPATSTATAPPLQPAGVSIGWKITAEPVAPPSYDEAMREP